MKHKNREPNNRSYLDIQFRCNSKNKTIPSKQYAEHPLRISTPFRLDRESDRRAYLYLRNNSPGLFSGDNFNISMELEENTLVYLGEQAATKVHPTIDLNSESIVNYQFSIGKNATLEFIPEALILYTDAALKQTTKIKMDRTATLFWSEIILPGRLARGEFYQFHYYHNRLEIKSDRDELLLKDTMYLEGKTNQFFEHNLFSQENVMANAFVIAPNLDYALLQQKLNPLAIKESLNVIVATSILPANIGIFIKVLGTNTQKVKNYLLLALNFLRYMQNQSLINI